MKKILSLLCISIVTGCASNNGVRESVPYDDSHSYAYNIALQTDLLDGSRSLRDYSKEEVEDMNADIMKTGENNALYVIGVAKLLTLDFSGIGALSGHASMKLSLSNSPASKQRIIVLLPKKDFKSSLEAEKYVVASVNAAAEKALKKFGSYEAGDVDEKCGIKRHSLCIEEQCLPTGVPEKIGYEGKQIKEGTMIDENNQIVPAYVYGLTISSLNPYSFLIGGPSSMYANFLNGKELISQDELLLDFSKNLPKGIYVYSPSRPVYRAPNRKMYIDSSITVPAIYTQGKKYEFIKPE